MEKRGDGRSAMREDEEEETPPAENTDEAGV